MGRRRSGRVAAGCNPVLERVNRFESYTSHHYYFGIIYKSLSRRTILYPNKYPIDKKREIVIEYMNCRSATSLSNKYGIPESTIRTWAKNILTEDDVNRKYPDSECNYEQPELEFSNVKKPNMTWREIGEFAKQSQLVHKRCEGSQDKINVSINTSQPIAITFSSDWHLGSVAADYDQFIDHIDYVLNTPNLYVITVGDEIDNFYRFNTLRPIFDQIIPPKIQIQMLRGIIDDLTKEGKILAACWGNHSSEFSEKALGFDIMEFLVNNQIPYLGVKGLINLNIGDQSYDHLIVHKTRYNSFLNRLHGNKREFQLTYPARVIITAHTHVPDFETYYHYGKRNFLIKCGTFKIDDNYSMRYYGKGCIGTPTLVYFPDRNHIVPFNEVRDAVQYMNGYTE